MIYYDILNVYLYIYIQVFPEPKSLCSCPCFSGYFLPQVLLAARGAGKRHDDIHDDLMRLHHELWHFLWI